MRFLVDECCDDPMIEWLRAGGHDVLAVKETMRGATDDVILQSGFDQQRILLTVDKDFGELVIRLRLPAYGIILFRLAELDVWSKINRLNDLLQADSDKLPGHLVVIEPDKFRFRPLSTS